MSSSVETSCWRFCVRFMIRRGGCMCGVPPIRSCSRGRRLLLWARGRARPTARRWRECWAASLRRRVSSSSAVLRVGWTARLTVARSRRTVTWVADDRLIGGPGNDRLHGNAGDDRYACGAGRDVVYADEGETVSGSCEVVHRQPASPPPACLRPGTMPRPGSFFPSTSTPTAARSGTSSCGSSFIASRARCGCRCR